jgi:23S rRNA pseudouridine955/2504/2580 synthase
MGDEAVAHWTVDPESAGQRLDNYLFRHLKGVPKTFIYRIVRSGEVRVNKHRVSADYRVAAGDLVRVPPMRRPEPTGPDRPSAAPAREFPVLFEDEALIAVNKPAGVAVHGGSGVSYGVIEQLRQARPQAPLLELVHRLDKETSGVLLVAKKRSALRGLQEQFRSRSTGKTYLALVKGVCKPGQKVIDAPLQKYLQPDGERRVRVVSIEHPDAMRAISIVSAFSSLRGTFPEVAEMRSEPSYPATLVSVAIKTGRTHQIRVHLSHAGHPIAGDEKYGDFEWNRAWNKAGQKRMFLHAWQLKFSHPLSGEAVCVHADLPPELVAMLQACQNFPSNWSSIVSGSISGA